MLAPMRYKDFTWPHNPKTYSISYERHTAVHKVPMGIYTMEDLGRTCRVMRGEGEFFGPNAYNTFKQLAMMFYENGPGVLFHPVWMTTSAYFTKLELTQEPREDYVAYAFEFRESFTAYSIMKKVNAETENPMEDFQEQLQNIANHTTSIGETLWDIAKKYGTTVQSLAKLNPTISNMNAITAGQKVRVQ